MRNLTLTIFGTLAGFAILMPTQAQTVQAQTEQSQTEVFTPSEPTTDISQTDISQTVEQLPPDLAEPLEVGQPQADEFFAPSQRQLPQNSSSESATPQERLIQPPPGTQTPGQLTPERRLSVPIE